jgi:hypothetical protein
LYIVPLHPLAEGQDKIKDVSMAAAFGETEMEDGTTLLIAVVMIEKGTSLLSPLELEHLAEMQY